MGIAAAVLTAAVAFGASAAEGNKPLGENLVGRQDDGSVLTSNNQYVSPAGQSVEHSGRPMDMAVRPDGKTTVNLTKSGDGLFTVVDLVNRKVLQQYTPPKGVGSGNIGVRGLLYSPDGNTLWAAQSGNLLRFDVAADGTLGNPQVIGFPADATVPKAPDGEPAQPLPTGLAWAPDGTMVVVLDGWDRVGILDTVTNTLTGQVDVGVAPRDVTIIGDRAFVTNEAGRKPTPEDFTNLSYDSPVVAEQRNGRASTGTVSEIDLGTNAVVATYEVGLDPSSMVAKGTDLLVTNSSDDSVSVIDTAARQVTQTVNVNPIPGQPYGSNPNALEFLDDSHFVVSLGRNNALAIYQYNGSHQAPAFDGLIPTAWYPGTVRWNAALDRLVVANQAGVGALGKERTIAQGPGTTPATGKQVYADVGSIELIAKPSAAEIAEYTSQVFSNNQWYGIGERNAKGSAQAEAVAVPRQVGSPSKIKHVFMIVRENRTYDQVFGDLPKGNGEPSMAQFGERYTPNAHALVQDFPLVDNLYSDGTNSASGHTWLDAAYVNDYLERSYANYVRNYGQPDAMVYPRSGFLWDNAMSHGLSTRVWGEYAEWFTTPHDQPCPGTWSQWYRDSQIMEGKAEGEKHVPDGYCTTKTDIPSLNKVLDPDFPNFKMEIPDQYRADLFIEDLEKYEKKGNLPSLNMLWMPTDHTNGLNPGYPTPAAMVADNDLATGRIIDAITHSRFWKNSAIFVVEDDSQNGVDHVDGHRNVSMVISPYAKRGVVDHTYYSQLNVTRTIEQILGLPPMNQMDMAAEPMYDSFTNTPNFRPYTFQPNRIPLDTLNPQPAQASTAIERQWIEWSQEQNYRTVDQLAFAPFNRMLWYSSTGWKKPYPGDTTVMAPAEVLAKFPQTTVQNPYDNDMPVNQAQIPHKAGRR